MTHQKHLFNFVVLLAILVLCLLPFTPVRAVVAYPQPIRVTQPDGSVITIRRHGDEHFHFTTDAAGYLVGQREDGTYCYGRYDRNNHFELSERVVGKSSKGLAKSSSIPQAQVSRAVAQRASLSASADGLSRTVAHPVRQLVLLVAFSDCDFVTEDPYQAFFDMLNEEGYSSNNGTGSVKDYYKDNSMGRYVPEFVVFGPVTLPNAMKSYGENDKQGNDVNPQKMAIDAVRTAYGKGLNISQFDADEDGELDNVFIYYAGYNEAEGGAENTIWPHSSSMSYTGESVAGLKLGSYACSSELRGANGKVMASIGTFCHEFGHTLGLQDVYDVDYSENGGETATLGSLSLMCSGNYNNSGRTPPYLTSEERNMLGWLEFKEFELGTEVQLRPIYDNEAYVCQTQNKGEYYLFENRQKTGWDSYINGQGMVVYHVDKSGNMIDGVSAAAKWQTNKINTHPSHPCFDVLWVDASGKTRYPYFPGLDRSHTTLTSKTYPALKTWGNLPLGIALSDIAIKDDMVSFKVDAENVDVYLVGYVKNRENNLLPNSVVTLIPVPEVKELPQRKAGGFSRLYDVRHSMQSSETRICTTPASGLYRFDDLQPGKYLLRCQAEGYVAHEEEITIADQCVEHDIIMLKRGEDNYLGSLTWSQSGPMMQIGMPSGSFAVGAKWTAAELSDYVGCYPSEVSINISQALSAMTAKLYHNSRLVSSKRVASPSTGSITVKMDNDTLPLASGTDILLEFVFDDGAYVGMDGGPAVVGKGDLVREGDGRWENLSEGSDFNANWVIGIEWYRPENLIPVESFSLQTRQLDLRVGEKEYVFADVVPINATYGSVTWTSSDRTVATVSGTGLVTANRAGKTTLYATCDNGTRTDSCLVTVWPTLSSAVVPYVAEHVAHIKWPGVMAGQFVLSVMTTDSTEVYRYKGKEPSVTFDGLKSKTRYMVVLSSYETDGLLADAEADEETHFEIQTQSSDISMLALNVNLSTYKSDSIILLDVLNLNEQADVVWMWDGKPLEGLLLHREDSDVHWLEARVTRPQKGTEIIRRKIFIK